MVSNEAVSDISVPDPQKVQQFLFLLNLPFLHFLDSLAAAKIKETVRSFSQ